MSALVLALLVPARPMAQPAAPAGDEARLQVLEQELAATLHSKSRADMERLLADDFLVRGTPDLDRNGWMKEALDRCWGDRFDLDDFSARVDGPTAVASFVLTFHVNPDTCAPGVMRSLITDVWVRNGDSWRLRLRHSSPASPGIGTQFVVVPEAPPRWLLGSELSFVSTAGNTETTTLGLAGDLTRQTDASNTRARFTFISSTAAEVTQARATAFSARHGIKLRPHLEAFGRLAYARDRFAGIDHRAAIDVGLAYTTGRPPRHQLTFEGGVGGTVEDRLASATLRFAAGTGTARYVWQVAPGTEVREEAGFMADLGERRNWRGTNSAALSVALTRLLSLKIANELEYRHLPVAGFRRTDSRTAAAIVLTLRAR